MNNRRERDGFEKWLDYHISLFYHQIYNYEEDGFIDLTDEMIEKIRKEVIGDERVTQVFYDVIKEKIKGERE